MHKRFLGRIRLLVILFGFAMLSIVGRLYFLQIVEGSAYTERADAEFIIPQNQLLNRAAIYFTAKDGTSVVAATMEDGFTLALNPTKITNPATLYSDLNSILPINYSDFLTKAGEKGEQYVVLQDHLPTQEGQELEAKNLPGVVIAEDRWREYPGGSLAAQTIGFVAYNGNTEEGRYGLEQEYNSTLTRTNQDLYTNFFVQIFGGVRSALQNTSQTGELTTTIEPTVQAELESTLASYTQQWHPQFSGGIIMNPQTGAIYAIAINPTFDLNAFSSQSNVNIFANPLVDDVYEMGSIIKPLTMGAGIDSGAITATTTYNDTGCITVNKSKICNFDFRARGVIPMQQILTQSLNVGASFIATQMGPSTMREYFINHYELGSTTGIDLPGERSGLVDTLYTKQQVDYDTAAFGQGIALTPIETLRALNSIVNGGYLVTPHIVQAIHYDTGLTKTLMWPSVEVLKPQSAETVKQMLITVVDTAVPDQAIRVPNYSLGAKTGTAQIVNPATRSYYTDRYLHSYFGFLPGSNPQFSIFLFAFEPVGAPYSADTWSPYFHPLTEFLINYYNIPPDR